MSDPPDGGTDAGTDGGAAAHTDSSAEPTGHPTGNDPTGGGRDPDDTGTAAVDSAGARPSDGPGGGSTLRAVGAAFGLGILGILVLLAVATLVGGAVFLVTTITGQQPSLAVSFVLPFVASQIVAFLGVGLVYLRWRGFDRRDIVEYLGLRRPSALEFVIAVVGPVVVLFTALTVGSIVLLFAPEPAQNQGAQTALENPSIIPIMIAAMLLVVGPCEEFLFRGVIQNRARETFSAAPAIFLAAAVFAPLHVVSLAGGVTAMLTTVSILFVPALIFGAVYEYTGNLVVVALMHGLYNSFLLTIGYIAITYGPELEESAQAGAALLGL